MLDGPGASFIGTDDCAKLVMKKYIAVGASIYNYDGNQVCVVVKNYCSKKRAAEIAEMACKAMNREKKQRRKRLS